MHPALKKHLSVLVFSVAYIVIFTTVFLWQGDYEFLWYVLVLLFFAGLVAATLHRSKFDNVILWGLSIWGFLHMAGGGIPVGDSVLYGLILVPIFDGGGDFTLLKYDQAVHLYGFAVTTLVVYHLIRPYLSHKVNWPVVMVLVALAGTGLGVVNEIVEFAAVLVLPETGVGGYYNTAFDLVFNTIGAAAAALYIAYYREEKVYAPQYGFVSKVKKALHLE